MVPLSKVDFQQYVVYPDPQAVYKYLNTLRKSTLSNIVSPLIFHSPDKPASACNIEQMDEQQLSSWVWTFSYQRGWEEGEIYASNFKNQGMKGELLG